jgi:hypothetical protein
VAWRFATKNGPPMKSAAGSGSAALYVTEFNVPLLCAERAGSVNATNTQPFHRESYGLTEPESYSRGNPKHRWNLHSGYRLNYEGGVTAQLHRDYCTTLTLNSR